MIKISRKLRWIHIAPFSIGKGAFIMTVSHQDPCNVKSSEIKALLKTRGEEVNVLDILIASSAYRLELTVITKDRDFQTISHCMDLDVILSL